MTGSQSSSVILKSRLSRVMPALFTSMWIPPSSLDDAVHGGLDGGGVDDVAADADRARRPGPRASARPRPPGLVEVEDGDRGALLANRCAVAKPMPRAAPVTTATRPS